MDIRAYFQKKRQVESTIAEPFAVVISLETSDGGIAGTATEVSRTQAARLIVDGKARLADPDEVRQFHQQSEETRRAAEQRAAAGKMQVAVLSEQDLRCLRGPKSGK